jgi:hypothetical protein
MTIFSAMSLLGRRVFLRMATLAAPLLPGALGSLLTAACAGKAVVDGGYGSNATGGYGTTTGGYGGYGARDGAPACRYG